MLLTVSFSLIIGICAVNYFLLYLLALCISCSRLCSLKMFLMFSLDYSLTFLLSKDVILMLFDSI